MLSAIVIHDSKAVLTGNLPRIPTTMQSLITIEDLSMEGQWCGSFVRAVDSGTRGLRFESSNREDFLMNIFTVNCLKDENKEK